MPGWSLRSLIGRTIPWQDAERLAREVSGPVELLVIEDGNHAANHRPYRYRPQTADWMAERVGAVVPEPAAGGRGGAAGRLRAMRGTARRLPLTGAWNVCGSTGAGALPARYRTCFAGPMSSCPPTASDRITDLVRRVFHAYQTADRSEIEPLLADDFTFTSPYDDHIDRAAYFERCWPNAGTFERFDIEQLTVDGDACFAVYTGTRRGGGSFHNTERFEVAGDRVRAVEVFFGLPPSTRPDRPPAEEVRRLLGLRERAIRHKDAAMVVALYARDAVGFGLAPPLRIDADQLHAPAPLEEWFAGWRGPIDTELRILQIRAGAETGFATALQHLAATSVDGRRIDMWTRSTFCFCREDGTWKIASVHDSVPFAMDGSYRAQVGLTP